MKAEKRVELRWQGDLAQGKGVVMAASSGQLVGQRLSWQGRTALRERETSPEELLAAAHAGCFAMGLSDALSKAGVSARHLDVTATVTFEQNEGGWSIVSSHLDVVASAPGIDELGFAALAASAKDNCPVSRALHGNVAISIDATLSAQDMAAAAGP